LSGHYPEKVYAEAGSVRIQRLERLFDRTGIFH